MAAQLSFAVENEFGEQVGVETGQYTIDDRLRLVANLEKGGGTCNKLKNKKSPPRNRPSNKSCIRAIIHNNPADILWKETCTYFKTAEISLNIQEWACRKRMAYLSSEIDFFSVTCMLC